jgi:hypothetical protein
LSSYSISYIFIIYNILALYAHNYNRIKVAAEFKDSKRTYRRQITELIQMNGKASVGDKEKVL